MLDPSLDLRETAAHFATQSGVVLAGTAGSEAIAQRVGIHGLETGSRELSD